MRLACYERVAQLLNLKV